MDRFLKAVAELDQDLTTLSNEERQDVIEELLQVLFTEPQYQVLQSSARMEYLRYRLEKTIKKMTWTLQEQGKRTKMRPVQTEVFSPNRWQRGHSGIGIAPEKWRQTPRAGQNRPGGRLRTQVRSLACGSGL